MEVKHRLAAVGVGVHDDAVAPLGQLGVTRQVAREGEQATEQLWIPRIVERREVISRNHEQVGRGLRIQILERHHTVGPLHDRRRNLARRDLAEDAPTHAPPPSRLQRFPNAWRNCSQNFLPSRSSAGGAVSTFASCSSKARCSAVSFVGVQTCTRTCRSPRPPSPSRGSPFPFTRYTAPVCVPGCSLSVAVPCGVGTSTSAPSAAWVNESGRS